MSNGNWFDEEIEKEAKVPIVACVIGNVEYFDNDDIAKSVPKDKLNKVLTWEEAKPYLHYDWDTGYGAPGCHPIEIYTQTDIISVYQYDGSTGFFRIPRNPRDHKPEMPGG